MYSKYSFIYFYGDSRQSCKDAYEGTIIAPEGSFQIDGEYLSQSTIFNSNRNGFYFYDKSDPYWSANWDNEIVYKYYFDYESNEKIDLTYFSRGGDRYEVEGSLPDSQKFSARQPVNLDGTKQVASSGLEWNLDLFLEPRIEIKLSSQEISEGESFSAEISVLENLQSIKDRELYWKWSKVNNVIDSSKDVFTLGLDEEDFDSGFSGMFKISDSGTSTIQFSVLSDSKEENPEKGRFGLYKSPSGKHAFNHQEDTWRKADKSDYNITTSKDDLTITVKDSSAPRQVDEFIWSVDTPSTYLFTHQDSFSGYSTSGQTYIAGTYYYGNGDYFMFEGVTTNKYSETIGKQYYLDYSSVLGPRASNDAYLNNTGHEGRYTIDVVRDLEESYTSSDLVKPIYYYDSQSGVGSQVSRGISSNGSLSGIRGEFAKHIHQNKFPSSDLYLEDGYLEFSALNQIDFPSQQSSGTFDSYVTSTDYIDSHASSNNTTNVPNDDDDASYTSADSVDSSTNFIDSGLSEEAAYSSALQISESEINEKSIVIIFTGSLQRNSIKKKWFDLTTSGLNVKIKRVKIDPASDDTCIILFKKKRNLQWDYSSYLSYKDPNGDQVTGVLQDRSGADIGSFNYLKLDSKELAYSKTFSAGDPDEIIGTDGNDKFKGQSGPQVFIASKGRDVIENFDYEEGDRLIVNGRSMSIYPSRNEEHLMVKVPGGVTKLSGIDYDSWSDWEDSNEQAIVMVS